MFIIREMLRHPLVMLSLSLFRLVPGRVGQTVDRQTHKRTSLA